MSKAGRLRLTVWQMLSSVLLLGLIGAVAALAYLNAGRPLPPLRVTAPTITPVSTFAPTLVVTPRVSAANMPTATPGAPVALAGPTPHPTVAAATPEPAPPATQAALIVNTSGLGVSVRNQPGPQSQRAGVLREGTRVLLTGNDQTVAARPWREIETEDHNLKGWVQGDFLQLQPTSP
ncbi:MAG: SH3 domain-containing protein [Chloroflexota bacterium]|nr:SH3 domain-containing protein [Chloroflexota bacterium]